MLKLLFGFMQLVSGEGGWRRKRKAQNFRNCLARAGLAGDNRQAR